ncbi:CAAX protease [Helicobacter ailurogastricus]|uniref:hypothetical protein n=1 Tax=Helicobacter ailurogastricus TaxID=1578720 RepID=UPI00244D8F60|nr:hypothetical protein [Helicobacter ailurogastricus]GMB90334.1 CAAX protease [Helicobacter ailurogastricus]
MYNIQQDFFERLVYLFQGYPHLVTPLFEKKIKQSIEVLHHQYLYGACKETKILFDKNQGRIDRDLFDVVMDNYHKRLERHQAYFFILQCFEHALRSTMATTLANAFNRDRDDWFLHKSPHCSYLVDKANARSKKLNKPIKDGCTTFDIFDLFSLGDLEHLLRHYYPYFEHNIFKAQKAYKGQPLLVYETKQHALSTIKRIRDARNEVFHNKPTHIKFQKDVVVLLLRLGYDLERMKKSINLQVFDL